MDFTFKKAERINSQLVIDKLFGGGNTAMSVFPLRAIYMIESLDEGTVPVRVLVSVPKKRFKHAVDRNRMKRQVREAYRLNKHELYTLAEEKGLLVSIAFICITDELVETPKVEKSMKKILSRIVDKIILEE